MVAQPRQENQIQQALNNSNIYIYIYHKPYHLKVRKLDKKGKEEFRVRDYDSANEFRYL